MHMLVPKSTELTLHSANRRGSAPSNSTTACKPTAEMAHYVNEADVYDCIGSSLVAAALRGVHCSLLSFRQAGSGKTHTLLTNRCCTNTQ